MRLAVLTSADSWHYQDLCRAADGICEITAVPFESLADTLASRADRFNHDLQQYDCLLARAMPSGSLQQVVFRMDVLLKLHQQGMVIINPPRTIEMAVDKYLCLVRLGEAGLPLPMTAVSQTLETALNQFQRLSQDVVIKPLFGSMGRGLERIDSMDLAVQRFTEILDRDEVLYQQSFIPHSGYDLRLLVVGDRVFSMRRNNSHWITNLSQGGIGSPHTASQRELELAQAAAVAIGASIAGVDLIYDSRNGEPMILEVNSAPSWRGISAVLNVDIAAEILQFLKLKTAKPNPVPAIFNSLK